MLNSWFKVTRSSEIDQMLQRGATLEEIMDCEDFVSTMKSQSKNLLDYISNPEIISKLLSFLVNVVQTDDKYKYKYPFIVGEILSEDISQIRETLLLNENLKILFDVISNNSGPIPAPYAHHICKILHSLLTQTGKELLDEMEKSSVITSLFQHLQSFPFCEFLFDIIMIVEQFKEKQGVVEFFHQYDVIYSLLFMMQTSLHPMVPPNAGQILTNIIRNFAPTHRTLLFEEIFQKKETDLLLQLALSPQLSLTNFTVSISLLIDVVWNTRFLPDDPSNQTEGVMYGLDEGQTLPPPPPEFVKKNLLANLGKFVECLMYDWSKTDSVGDVTLSQHTDAGSHHHHSPAPPTSPRAKGKKKGSIPTTTATTSTSGKQAPILSPRAKGGASSVTSASASSSSSANSPTTTPSPPSSSSPSSSSVSLPHPFPSPSPAQTPTTAIAIPCPPCLRNGHSVGNYRLKLIILLSTLIRSGYNDEIDTAFIANKVFQPLIALFFAHPANNIVHSELYTLFEQTMLFRTSRLKVDLCVTSKLVDNVAEELENERIRAEEKQKEVDDGTAPTARASRIPSSQAFLAHLLHLARILQEHRETLPELDEAIRRFDRWTANYEAVVDPQMKEQAEDGLMRLPTEEEGGDAYGGQMGENPFAANTDGWNFGSTGDGEDDYHG